MKENENPFVIVNKILIDVTSDEKEVMIPDSVTTIGESVFSGCTTLESIIIPDSVTTIGKSAFYNCTALASVTIPDSVTSLGTNAFDGTPWFEKIKENENLLTIVNKILIDVTSDEKEVMIPDGVTTIGGSAFSYCESLTSVTIPDSVITIGESAFYRCNSLISATIPDSVTTIGEDAFYGCESLTSVIIKNPECEIDDNAIPQRYLGSLGTDLYFFEMNVTIYGYDNSTAQAYAEKYDKNFVSLGTAPASTSTDTNNTSTTWNGVNPDVNGDGKIDASDAAWILSYAAAYGAGNVESFSDFMEQHQDEIMK